MFHNRLLLISILGISVMPPVMSWAQVKSSGPPPLSLGAPFHDFAKEGRGAVQILSPYKGTLVYGYDVFATGRPAFLAVARLSNSPGEILGNTSFRYPVSRPSSDNRGTNVIYDPQFSPDGRYILFKYGLPTQFDAQYQLYVFDTQTQKITSATQEMPSYRLVSWSPDGKYIAFLTGGDVEGNTSRVLPEDEVYTGPLALCLCEWQTQKTTTVTTNDTIRGPFSWVSPHTLVYGMLPESKTNKPTSPTGVRQRPNVYSYSPESATSQQIINDGYRPAPSPNGRWFIFYGSEDPVKPLPLRTSWEVEPQGASLSIFDTQSHSRLALNREGGLYSSVCWLPDNRHFLTLKESKSGVSSEAEVREWDVQTRKFRSVCMLTARDYKFTPRSIIERPFYLLGLSHDNKTLFVSMNELVGHEPSLPTRVAFARNQTKILAIDLTSGSITPILQVQGFSGSYVDWH